MDDNTGILLRYEKPLAYTRLFRSSGVVVLCLGILMGAIQLMALIAVLMMAGPTMQAPVPGVIVALCLGLGLDSLLVVGSMRSRELPPRGRDLIILFTKGDLAAVGVAVMIAVISFLLLPSHVKARVGFGPRDAISLDIILLRVTVDAVIYWLYSGLRADCYFRQTTRTQPCVVGPPMARRADANGALAAQNYGKPEPAVQFVVRGIDERTGQETEYHSNAATEELARKSAIVMGLRPDSIRLTPSAEPR